MKMPWEKEEKKEEKEDDIELKAKDVKEKLDTIDTLKADVTTMKTSVSKIDAMAEYFEKLRAKDAAAEAAKNKKDKDEKAAAEEEDLDFLGDPLNAVKTLINKGIETANTPLIRMTVQTQSRQLAKEHFGENPQFEFYSDPTFKAEVDKLISTLPLNSQIDTASLENCYAVVAFKKAQDIKEGKIKARFAAASGTASGTGADSNTNKEMVLTSDQKKAAAMFGMTEKEYGDRFQKEHSIV